MSTQSQLTDTALSEAGFTKHRTKHTGVNLSNAFYTRQLHSQTVLMIGGPFHIGKHAVQRQDTFNPTPPPTMMMTHPTATPITTHTPSHNPPRLVHITPPHHSPHIRTHHAPNIADNTSYNPKRWLNDPAFCPMVGRSMSHSLTILGLGLGASEMEIKVQYRQLARRYCPDKNDITSTGLTTTEASDFFKLLNNANEHLKECH